MSTKTKLRKLLEQTNKRLLNEDMQPPVNFTEYEVLSMMAELIDYDLGGEEEMPPKLVKILQDGLKKKGRNLDPPNVPDGAMM